MSTYGGLEYLGQGGWSTWDRGVGVPIEKRVVIMGGFRVCVVLLSSWLIMLLKVPGYLARRVFLGLKYLGTWVPGYLAGGRFFWGSSMADLKQFHG